MSDLNSALDDLLTLNDDKKDKKLVQKSDNDNKSIAKTNAKTSSENYFANLKNSQNNLTPEQREIIESKEHVLKIKAYAGAGKTFILDKFSRLNIPKTKRGLYIAFNKDMKKEAEQKLPSNVKCMTMHGLAYARFGKDLQPKLQLPFYPNNIYNISEINYPDPNVKDLYAKILYDAITQFTFSKNLSISQNLLDMRSITNFIELLKFMKKDKESLLLSSISVNDIVKDLRVLWEALINPNDLRIGTTHDTYLKLMQLASPQLPYSTILLDEAQDVNPAMLALFEKQKMRKVLAGDPYQSIYGFRNAIDAMTLSYADKTYYLSKTFRFGERIASLASSIIKLRDEHVPVIGNENVKSNIEFKESLTKEKLLSLENKVVITRTNAQMFEEALTYSQMGFKIHMTSEKVSNFSVLKELYNLRFYNEKPRNSFLKDFFSGKNGREEFEAFKTFVKDNGLHEYLIYCYLIEEKGLNLLKEIDSLNTVEKFPYQSNDIVVITNVHKSKGLEFDNVILSDDFDLDFLSKVSSSNGMKIENFDQDDNENVNLLYVAVTRAKKNLFISEKSDIFKVLRF